MRVRPPAPVVSGSSSAGNCGRFRSCSQCGVPGAEHEDVIQCADALIAYYAEYDKPATVVPLVTRNKSNT